MRPGWDNNEKYPKKIVPQLIIHVLNYFVLDSENENM